MNTIRIILFGSPTEGSWFLSRKARELIDYHLISPAELFFVYDSVEKMPLFGSSLGRHRIPFIKAENVGKIHKAGCILINLKSFYSTDIFLPGWYFFFLLSRPLQEKRIDLVRHLKVQNIGGAYLVLCSHARQEGEDLSYLLNAEMVTDPDWRDPGVVYFQKENDHWQPYWQDIPRWMVPEVLVRIADTLAKQQKEFLDRGFSGMAALTMREVASTVGCAESSVSRIVAGLEAETPWGRLPLKCFFSQRVPSTLGFTSRTSIIERIARLISTENKRKLLSDEQLTKIFRLEGINIARRTVTKYRRKLGIASSPDRKKDGNKPPEVYPGGEEKKSVLIDTPNDPLSDTYYLRQGLEHVKEHLYKDAINDFTRAISANWNDSLAWFNRGLTYFLLGDEKMAKADIEIAANLGNGEARRWLSSQRF